jgi:hypothetical protein
MICRRRMIKLKLNNQVGTDDLANPLRRFPIRKIETNIKLIIGAINHPTTITKPLID